MSPKTQAESALRLALVECVAASLLHAVANCTNVIVGRAGMLEMMRPDDPELARTLHEIRAQAEGIATLGALTREFVASGTSEADAPSCAGELDRVLSSLAPLAKSRAVELDIEPIDARLDPGVPSTSLHAILYGLLGYAVRAVPSGSVVRAEIARAPTTGSSAAPGLVLTVRLPRSCSIPTGRRELVAPWLTGAVEDADARLLLALGLGSAHERGGRFQVTDDGVHKRVVVKLPLPGADRGRAH